MPWVESDVAEAAPPTGGRWVESDEAPVKKKPPADVVGLSDRALVQAIPEAIMGLPALAADAYDSLSNLTNMGLNAAGRGSNAVLGTNFGQLPAIPAFRHSGAVARGGEWAADKLGLPKPEGTMQEGLTKIGTAALSALGGAGVAKIGGALADGLPQLGVLLNSLAEAPKLQAAGAAGSTLAQDIAQKNGVQNPLALMAIGAVGGAGHTPFTTGAGRVAGGAVQLAKPFTQGGREVIVGKALNRLADTPGATANRMENALPIIPGSDPMVSQVSQDAGLIRAQGALEGMEGGSVLKKREADQNKARMDELNRITRDEDTLDAATAKRDSTVQTHKDPAFRAKSPVGVDYTPVETKIDEILKSRKGVRVIVQDAMGEVQNRLKGLTESKLHDATDPENLYEVRKDLADLRDGKYNTDKSDYKLAKGEIQDVISTLDSVIESGAPGYKDYMGLYSKRSIPLDQLKATQELRRRAVLPISDPVNQTPILGANFTKLLGANLDKGLKLRGKGPGAGNLSDNQLLTLDRVAADLDRSNAAQAKTIKPLGSDTFKNMSVAAVIGRILGDETGALVSDTNAAKSLYRPISFLYRMPDQAIQHLMLEVWQDPKLASRLMKKATQHEVDSIANELKQRAGRQAMGAALYSGQE